MLKRFLFYLIIFYLCLFIIGCQTNTQQHITNPPSVNFYATPTDISPGEEVTLHWNVQNATYVSIEPDIGEITDLQGTMIVNPDETKDYTLTAINESDSSIATITITVNDNNSM